MPDRPAKPLPEADAASEPFYRGAMEGRLVLMRCRDCRTWRLPARQHCDVCLSDQADWEEACGRGQVRTFGTMHQRYHPGFEYPYNLAIVELEEGPRLPTNIVGVEPGEVYVGMPVVVEWERHEDVALPKFRPA